MVQPTVIIREPREKKEKPFKIDFESLTVPALIGGVLVLGYVYREELAQLGNKIVDTIPHAKEIIGSIDIPIYPLPPITFPQPQPGPQPIGGSSAFGGGEVSLHSLQSGGSAWRKQWTLSRRYLNMQFSGYFLIPSGNNGIAIKLRGGPHTGNGDNATTRQGCSYIFFLPFNGSSKNNFQKECPHPDYSKHTVPVQFSAGSIIGKWTGVRCRLLNQGNGVRCTMWLDTSGNRAGQWRLWYDILDTGQYGDSAATKPPFTKSPVFGNNPRQIIRIDGSSESQVRGYQMAGASIGEIASANLAYLYNAERITVA